MEAIIIKFKTVDQHQEVNTYITENLEHFNRSMPDFNFKYQGEELDYSVDQNKSRK